MTVVFTNGAPRPRLRVLAAVALLTTGALAAASTRESEFLSVSPGPAFRVSDVLHVTNPADGPTPGNPQAGDPLITTIRAERLTIAEALWCSARPSCTPTPAGRNAEAPADQMSESLRAADAAANYTAASAAALTHPDAPGQLGKVRGIGGPSAGLSLTLALLTARTDGNLFAGHTVAATGTVTSSGDVGPVGGVALKWSGAVNEGADVMFVPAVEQHLVPTSSGLHVVGVETVADAVAWLCAHGGTGPLCGSPGSPEPLDGGGAR